MFNLNAKEGEAYMLPVKIKVFKNDETPETKKEIIHVIASFNHSLALSKTGKLYTWGYSGKGILGRFGK
jgi:alpha-tubulin suppressor-like RCC1 family protein